VTGAAPAGVRGALAQLAAWKASARAGDRFEYYHGFLTDNFGLDLNGLNARDAIRAETARLYLTGEYELAQARVGRLSDPGSTFAYFIIKRGFRDTAPRFWKRLSDTEVFRAGKPHQRAAA
jgi:hypothetical protein